MVFSPHGQLDRRRFLGCVAAALAAAAAPAGLRAGAGDPARRFLFVFNPGGWDPLTALVPKFDAAGIDMSPVGDVGTAGGLRYVDGPAVGVREFFDQWHDRTALIHGVSVPSVSHDICTNLVLTGRIGADRPDWATRIGDARAADFTIPSLIASGPGFPGDLGVSSARAGTAGQLQALLDGSILGASDEPLPEGFRDATQRLLDRYARARTAARADHAAGGADADLTAAWHGSTRRVQDLRDAAFDLSFGVAPDLRAQLDLAVRALGRGLSRVVSVSSGTYGSWDTHQNNDTGQVPLFDQLFRDLSGLARQLANTPGASGGSLLDETTVVVCSEMGRTPTYNANAGRDHWPFTSMMLFGAGVAGGRVVGDLDDAGFGAPIDLASGEVTASGIVPTIEHVGATLLAMADVDPGATLPGIAPIDGLRA